MNIGWVYPCSRRCGIAMYSAAYVDALRSLAGVRCFDLDGYCGRPAALAAAVNACDLVHVQYETTFFLRGRGDWYGRFCRRVTRPLFVTLHEVYRRFPFVFPREQITGGAVMKTLKTWLYDARHPMLTAYRRHEAAGFHAASLLVHYDYQKRILADRGVDPGRIAVLAHPVRPAPAGPDDPWTRPAQLHLVSAGFVTPAYDYDLLFASLDMVEPPWRFTWIGGLRREEDRPLLARVEDLVAARGWRDRFTVTGWLDDAARDRFLATAHVYLALFSHRSASGSLTVAVGARQCIIATRIECTEELVRQGAAMMVVDRDAGQVAGAVRKVRDDRKLREKLREECARYTEANSYARLAVTLAGMYDETIRAAA